MPTTVYGEFLLEREEINRYKWLESEKAGRDIGWEKAVFNWTLYHRPAWVASRKEIHTKILSQLSA